MEENEAVTEANDSSPPTSLPFSQWLHYSTTYYPLPYLSRDPKYANDPYTDKNVFRAEKETELYSCREEEVEAEHSACESLVGLCAQVFASKLLASAQHPNVFNSFLELPEEAASAVVEKIPLQRVDILMQMRQLELTKRALPVVSLMYLLYAIEEYEFQYLCSSQPIDSRTMSEPLIDVWRNYDTFILQDLSKEAEGIGKFTFANPPPTFQATNMHSVVDENTFIKRFSAATQGNLDTWTEWNNMVAVGGAVFTALLPTTANENEPLFEVDDELTICLYGLEDEELELKIKRLYDHLKQYNQDLELRTRLSYTTREIVVFISDYSRPIQVITTMYRNIEDILFQQNIDCSAVAYNGTRVLATQRSRFSLNHQVIVTSPVRFYASASYGIDIFNTGEDYYSQMIAYSKCGFYIWDKTLKPDFSNISLYFLNLEREEDEYHQSHGLRALLVAYLWPKTHEINQQYQYEQRVLGSESKFCVRITDILYAKREQQQRTKTLTYHYKQYLQVCRDLSAVEKDHDRSLRLDYQQKYGIFYYNIFLHEEKQIREGLSDDVVKGFIRCRCGSASNLFVQHWGEQVVCGTCGDDKEYCMDLLPLNSFDLLNASELLAHRLGTTSGKDLQAKHSDDPYSKWNYPLSLSSIDTEEPLLRAVQRGDFVSVKEQLMNGANAHSTDEAGMTALHHAAMRGHSILIPILVKYGEADMNVVDVVGMTPLHWGCEKGFYTVVKELVRLGANVDLAPFGISPLMLAVKLERDPIARMLLRAGANVEGHLGEGGMTPLHVASLYGNCLGVLLEFGANINARCGDGMTPLFLFAHQSERVSSLLARGAEPDAANDYGETPLMAAVQHFPEMPCYDIELILVSDTNAKRYDGASMLDLGYLRGHCYVAENDYFPFSNPKRTQFKHYYEVLLIGSGTKEGITQEGLVWFSHLGDVLNTKSLLQRLDCSDFSNENIAKILHAGQSAAAMGGQILTLSLLLKYGHDRDIIPDPRLVFFAAQGGNVEVGKLVLENGGCVEDKLEEDGPSPIEIAHYYNHHEMVDFLLANGAKPSREVLVDAVQEHDMEKLSKLRQYAMEHKPPEGEMTLLHWAALTGSPDIAEQLIGMGEDVNAKCGDGMTPLHMAALGGHASVVALLVKRGARTTEELNDGTSVLQCAEQNGHNQVVELLRNASQQTIK